MVSQGRFLLIVPSVRTMSAESYDKEHSGVAPASILEEHFTAHEKPSSIHMVRILGSPLALKPRLASRDETPARCAPIERHGVSYQFVFGYEVETGREE